MVGERIVIDIKTRNRFSSSRAAHAVGAIRDRTTDSRRSDRNIVLVDQRHLVKAIIDSIPRRRGQKPIPFVEFVIAGPPPYHSPEYKEKWSMERTVQWFEDTTDWITRVFGPDVFWAYKSFHGDETSPHAHYGMIPLVKDRRGPKLSWSQCVTHAAQSAPGASARPGRRAYRFLLESYAADVGRHYGLRPGTPKPDVSPEAINRTKALDARIERSILVYKEERDHLKSEIEADKVELAKLKEKREEELAERKKREDAMLSLVRETELLGQRAQELRHLLANVPDLEEYRSKLDAALGTGTRLALSR